MPTWLGNLQQVSATSTRAYGASLLIIAICTGLGIIPLLLMRMPKVNYPATDRYSSPTSLPSVQSPAWWVN